MSKKNILIIGVLIVGAILIIQLFNIQIINKEFKITAENNAFKYITKYPVRGLIYDRNNKILVGNNNSYDIMVTPIEIKEFDTTDFCKIFNLDINELRNTLNTYKENKRKIGYQTLSFLKQVSIREYSNFIEKAYKFPGFSAISRSIRSYPFNAGANLFGYITEASQKFLDNNPSYKKGDYIGVSGLEQAYENKLKGEKGYSIFLRDVHNRIQSNYENGSYDMDAIPGEDIISTIDGELQKYGELLMQNKIGSIVAIEPSTGEILALITSPGINIEELSSINKYYNQLANDPYKPMFNRAVMSTSPPGSVFKIINGLIALQEGIITENTYHTCYMGYYYGSRRLGCHAHVPTINFTQSIMMSCNTYYCYVFKDLLENKKYANISESFNHWRSMVMSFGFGKKLGTDFPSELSGSIPKAETYDKIYGKDKWRSNTVISLSIGQGELSITPLHLANFAATLANRGFYYTPHLVKKMQKSPINKKFTEKRYTLVDTSHFKKVINGMYLAVNNPERGGTAGLARIYNIDVCGKTGTVQNPHGENNSVFICFAPKDNPKIAIATYIENAGYGGTWAAPIASLLIEKYLSGEISRLELEKQIINANLLNKTRKK